MEYKNKIQNKPAFKSCITFELTIFLYLHWLQECVHLMWPHIECVLKSNAPYIVGLPSLVVLGLGLVLPQLLQELRLGPAGVGQRGGRRRGRRHQLRTQAGHRGLCITAEEKHDQ